MKKPLKIFLIILLVVVAAGGIFIAVQWSNVESWMLSSRYTPEQLQSMISKDDRQRKEAIDEIDGLGVRELTDSEKQSVANGTMSESEALQHITNQENIISKDESDSKSEAARQKQVQADMELSSLVGRVYVLEAKYSGAVEGLKSSAIAEYKSLPPEQHTESNKYAIAAKYLARAASLESSCDSEIAGVLSRMEKVLVESGRDTGLVTQIRNTYYSEKSLKKAYYMSQYK